MFFPLTLFSAFIIYAGGGTTRGISYPRLYLTRGFVRLIFSKEKDGAEGNKALRGGLVVYQFTTNRLIVSSRSYFSTIEIYEKRQGL